MQKQLKIELSGKQYLIATDENDENVYAAAEMVDALLKSKKESMPHSFDDRVALVVALNLATDLIKQQKITHAYESKLANLLHVIDCE